MTGGPLLITDPWEVLMWWTKEVPRAEKERAPRPGDPAVYDCVWRVRRRLPERFGQACRVLVRGGRNSCLVEFEDGTRVVTSRWYVRRRQGEGGLPSRRPSRPVGPAEFHAAVERRLAGRRAGRVADAR